MDQYLVVLHGNYMQWVFVTWDEDPKAAGERALANISADTMRMFDLRVGSVVLLREVLVTTEVASYIE